MATARGLSVIFLLSLLVASSCLADVAQGFVLGTTLTTTNLQEQPGTGQFTFVKLAANTALEVNCRLQSSVVGGNSWWLHATAKLSRATGYVTLHDSKCDGDDNCEHAPHC